MASVNPTSDAAPRSPRARMQAGLEELAQITARLAFIGQEFNDVIVDTTNETAVYKARVAELEAKDSEQRKLLRKSGQFTAERKLKLVKRTMQSLLQQLGPDDGVESSPNPGHPRTVSIPSTPRGNEHPRRRNRRSQASVPSSPMPPSAHSLVPSAHEQTTPKRSPSIGPDVNNEQAIHPVSITGQSLDTILDMPKINLEDNWRMSTTRTPKSAHPVCPIPFNYFEDRLHLDEDVMFSLESLAHTDDISFHVQIVRDMVFVHEPIALDGPEASILFDFGAPSDNQNTAEYIKNSLPSDGIFHTFIFPAKKDRAGQSLWFYIGAHKWCIVPSLAIWQTLSEKSRKTIITRLGKQCNSKYDEKQLRQMLQEGQLETFCVQVSSASCRARSEAFATNTLRYVSLRSVNIE